MKRYVALVALAALAAFAPPAQAKAVQAWTVTPPPGRTVDPRTVGPLSRKVLRYAELMKQLVARAHQPGFTIDGWAPLGELVTIGEFRRVGNMMEVQTWREYTGFLTQWAAAGATHDNTVRRISEVGNVVFLELEERNGMGGKVGVVNSLSVYEFNQAGKIKQLDIYLQQKP